MAKKEKSSLTSPLPDAAGIFGIHLNASVDCKKEKQKLPSQHHLPLPRPRAIASALPETKNERNPNHGTPLASLTPSNLSKNYHLHNLHNFMIRERKKPKNS